MSWSPSKSKHLHFTNSFASRLPRHHVYISIFLRTTPSPAICYQATKTSPLRTTSSPAMAAVAVVVSTAPLVRLPFAGLRRGHAAPPPPSRRRLVEAAAARRRSDGGQRQRRARGADQEQDVSAVAEVETADSTSYAHMDKGVKLTPEPTSDYENQRAARKASAVRRVALLVLAAVIFGVSIALRDGVGKASEYFAGYLLEQSLSVDNLFVFILIFNYFKVPKKYESRVLSYGIAGAVIFRAVMIILGAATIQRFEVVNLLLALILLFSSYKLFAAEEDESDLSDNFIVKTCQKFIPVTDYYDGDRFFTNRDGLWKATPLLLTVAVIELSDIAFAVDSIPAVFGVTTDPLIVFSSNIFAISGLRSLYILISESMSELEYLQPAIGIVLGFIGTKMIFDFFGYHIPTEASLAIVTTCLSGGVILSLRKRMIDEQSK